MNIREATIDDLEIISKIHVDAWKDTYKGIVPETHLSKMSYDIQREKWKKRLFTDNINNEKMFLLETEDRILGFSSGNSIDENRARINTIYFVNDARGQGHGTELFNYTIKKLNRNIIEVWCFEENENRVFYEKLGGSPGDRQCVQLGEKVLVELQYLFRY